MRLTVHGRNSCPPPVGLTVHGEPVEGNDSRWGIGYEGVSGGGRSLGDSESGGGGGVVKMAEHSSIAGKAQQHLRRDWLLS
jgi:hypothetical protein